MENPTSFDLNNSIQRWRDDLSRSPHFRREDLAELEAHLRDSAAALEGRGLTGEEAFLVATRRLGNPAGLEPEFAKINRSEVWLNRALWMLIGIQGWWLLGSLARLGADAAVLGGLAGFGYNFQPASRTGSELWHDALLPMTLLSLANIFALAGCGAVCWWLMRHKDNTVRKLGEKISQRPVLAGFGLTFLFLGLNSVTFARWPLLQLRYSPQALGVIATSMSLAGSILALLQTVGLVVLTVLLLRRRAHLGAAG
jgi:hypothetical protein